MKLSFECSPRYCVWGIYADRGLPIIRVYPLPFVRVTFDFSGMWGI